MATAPWVHVAFAALALASLSCGGGAKDPPAGLNGTWGLPPDDAKLPDAARTHSGWSFSGSYLSVFNSDASGKAEAKLLLNGQGWHCHWDGPLVWNGRTARYEWRAASFLYNAWHECWLSAEPAGERLKVAISCSSRCKSNEVILVGNKYASMEKPGVHEFLLDRIAEDRLVPPPGITEPTFCTSHDTLRQALCRSGSIDASVERARSAAENLRVLGTGDKAEDERALAGWSVGDTKQPLLAALATCQARGGDAACLQEQIDDQADALEARVAERRRALREEQEKSSAAQRKLDDAPVRAAWEGTWCDDKRGHTLVIEKCATDGCDLSSRQRGVKLYFTGATSAYGYVKDGEARMGKAELHYRGTPWEDRHATQIVFAAERQPWAKYCRFELTRAGRGLRLDLHGIGCDDYFWDVSERQDYHADPGPCDRWDLEHPVRIGE